MFKFLSVIPALFITIALTACSNQGFDLTVENGNDVLIETDQVSFTRQDVLNELGQLNINNNNVSLQAILDWVDYEILSNTVEIDESSIDEEVAFLEVMFGDDLDQLLLSEGFATMDDYVHALKINLLREQAVRDNIVVTEEQIENTFNAWFANVEEPEVPEGYEPDDLDEEDETYVANLEDYRESIENWLIDQTLQQPGLAQEILAELRANAGFAIHSRYLADLYNDILDAWNIDVSVEHQAAGDDNVAASIDGAQLTVEQLFETLLARHALHPTSPIIRTIDTEILSIEYNADHDEVRNRINQMKLQLLDRFYPQMAAFGLNSEREIFDHFLFTYLQEQAIEANFTPDDATIQELYDNYVPRRHVRHILVEDRDLAEDIIAQLEAVPSDEVLALFTELAAEYGTDGTASNGGSLGFLSLPSGMVQEFEEPAFALGAGEFSKEPVETQFGYHVIYVEEIEPTLTLAQHRDAEMQRIFANTNLFESYMIGLRQNHHLTINHPFLQTQYEARTEQTLRAVENQ